MKNQDVFEKGKVVSLNSNPQTKEETLRVFVKELSSSLNVSVNDFWCGVKPLSARVVHNMKLFQDFNTKLVYKYSNEKIKIQFTPVDSNTVELQWIEVYDNGKGLGSDLMNDILDVSDKTQIKVKVLPVDFKFKEYGGYLNRLRDWYKSFGFTSKIYNNTPYLYYYPQPEEVKMAS